MNYSTRIGVILAGALAAAACGGSSVSIDDLPGELEAAQCGRAVRCGVFTSLADCKAFVNADITQLRRSIEAGRVSYDGDLVADCVSILGSASCDETVEDARVTPKACTDAIRGTVADAGTCYTSQECVSGSCDRPSCNMACCVGTCNPTVADAAIGQSCAAARCVDGAFCNASNVCAALLAANAPCNDSDECQYGLFCPDATCVPSVNRGEACPDGICNDVGDRCSTEMSCVPLSGVGGYCEGGSDCQIPLICNPGSTCEAPPALGQACQDRCAAGAFCNNAGTCVAPQANGATCNSGDECASSYCNGNVTPRVCADRQVCG